MKTFLQIATGIGELVEEKNAAYGSSFAKAGEFLRLLYPNGLLPEQYADALLLVLIFDKQMRIATDRDALGESPFADLAGYGILGAHLHQQKEGCGECLDSASGLDARTLPGERPDSVAPDADGSTTTSASASTGTQPSPRPASFCAQYRAATAPTATEDAKPSMVERQRFPRLSPLHRALIRMFESNIYKRFTRDTIKCFLRISGIAFTCLPGYLDQLVDLGFVSEWVDEDVHFYIWRHE
jgi:hypothetical protein